MKSSNKFLWGVFIIGALEILIGSITLIAVVISLIFNTSTKPFGVLSFVLLSSLASFILGWGIWAFNKKACELLKYFASIVIFSKVLIFLNIITLHGALETTIPDSLKNILSLIYHSLVLWYLNQKSVKNYFLSKS